MNVVPSVVCRWRSSNCISSRSLRSSAPSGSSSSRTLGLPASARAIATRCCMPPGELGWPLLGRVREAHELEHLGGAAPALLASDALHLERVCDVVLDRHVREERVALEDRVGIAAERRQVDDVDARDADAALIRTHEARDDAHRRGLAAAARPEDGEELAGRHVQGEVRDRLERAVAHGDRAQRDGALDPLLLVRAVGIRRSFVRAALPAQLPDRRRVRHPAPKPSQRASNAWLQCSSTASSMADDQIESVYAAARDARGLVISEISITHGD